MNELLQFLVKNGYEVDDRLKELLEEYYSKDVKVGQEVWVISKDYNMYEIIKCTVRKKQTKNKDTFTVRGRQRFYYYGTFTKNSIGKTVFFTKEEAIESLKGKEYKIDEN